MKILRKSCVNCQCLLSGHENICPECQSKQPTVLETQLIKKLRAILPEMPATKVLIGINAILFILLSVSIWANGGTFSEIIYGPSPKTLLDWGAHLRGDMTLWRMITANFTHIGLMHILFNAYAIYVIAPIEKIFGSALTFAGFVFLGAIAMILSNFLGAPGVVSAGASGAIMAEFGMIISGCTRIKTRVAIEIRNKMLMWAGFVVVLGIIIDMSTPMGIDNIGHIAGLGAGLIFGAFLPLNGVPKRYSLAGLRFGALALIAALAVLAYAFSQLFVHLYI